MKKRSLTLFVCIVFLLGNAFAQKGNLILSFKGKDINTNAPVPLISVSVKNLTKDCDTTIYGEEPYLYLTWPTAIGELNGANSDDFWIEPNFPNPFNASTSINLSLKNKQIIRIVLYDIYGAVVSEFENELNYGFHNFRICVGNKGLYFVSINSAKMSKTLKLISSGNYQNNTIYYAGKNDLQHLKEITTTNFFAFQPGDILSMTAMAEGYFENVIYDNPIRDTTFAFLLQPEVVVTQPSVITSAIADITEHSATSGGDVIDNGGASVTAKGVCWSMSQNPTTDNEHTLDGGGTGAFVSSLEGLSENTTYYVKAYATNEAGTAYGDQLSFSTPQLANVSGYVYFAGSTIPISGADVSINEIYFTTGASGYYEFSGIPVGNQMITATKVGYTSVLQAIEIPSSGLEYNIEMVSDLFTHKIFGTILNQSGDSISGVYGVVLNPDGSESDLNATSNLSGDYQILNVPEGERTIRFKKESCETTEIEALLINSNYELNIEMQEYGLPCQGEPTISYEGQVYTTVFIGGQCWIKENLNVGQMINGSIEMTNNMVIEKYCYDNDPSNCDAFGGLYQWNEMMKYSSIEGSQGICPPNWHVPSNQEWKNLEGSVDSQYPVGDPEWDGTDWRGFDAGERLKSQNGWVNNGNGNDLFGFAVLPGGSRYTTGNFNFLGEYAYYWTSTKINSNIAWYRNFGYENSGVYRYYTDKIYGRSVRCIKNL